MVPSDFFEKDKAILHDKGITEYDLSLMLDALA
jgi:hypothetical protein